jgi:hypothetical protein
MKKLIAIISAFITGGLVMILLSNTTQLSEAAVDKLAPLN